MIDVGAMMPRPRPAFHLSPTTPSRRTVRRTRSHDRSDTPIVRQPIEWAEVPRFHWVTDVDTAFHLSHRRPRKIVEPSVATTPPARRIGFLKGQTSVPPDFDTLGQAEIEAMFGV